jgi:hypothetical protein
MLQEILKSNTNRKNSIEKIVSKASAVSPFLKLGKNEK